LIRAGWQRLAASERRMLGGGAVVAVLLLGWALVWHPLSLKRAELTQDVANQRRDLAYVRLGAAEVAHLRVVGTRSRSERQGKSLLALADASARGGGLERTLRSVQPVGAHSVRVIFESANFDALMRWVEKLARDYGIQATDLSVDRADGLGMVNARVTLQDAP
jgi:general secretion pathway protein M